MLEARRILPARRASVTVFRGKYAAFVAIPKSDEYQEISSLITNSLEKLEGRVHEIRSPCEFTPCLLETCKKADFVIADITEINPSTYYIIGASQASQKPILLLSKEDSSTPPEISGFKVLRYKPGNVRRVSEFLRYFLSDILDESPLDEAGPTAEVGRG
jgi:hypothetical protein